MDIFLNNKKTNMGQGEVKISESYHKQINELIKENEKLKEHKIELLKLLKWISKVTNNPEIGERCDKATSKYKQYT